MKKRCKLLLLSMTALMALALYGCSGPDVATARAAVERARSEVVEMRKQVDVLQQIAQESGNEKFKAAAIAAENTLKLAEAKLPEMEAALKNLEDSTPGWKAAVIFAIPWIPRVALLIPGVAAVPAAGPILQWLARIIANSSWALAATKEHKKEDDGTIPA